MLWGEGLDALCRDSFKCLGCLSRSSPHILLFCFFNFSKPFLFSILLSHYSLSPPPSSFDSILSLALALVLILLFNFCPFSATSVLVSQHSTAASRPLTYSFHSHHHSESENHLLHCHLTLVPSIPSTGISSDEQHPETSVLLYVNWWSCTSKKKNNSAFV